MIGIEVPLLSVKVILLYAISFGIGSLKLMVIVFQLNGIIKIDLSL